MQLIINGVAKNVPEELTVTKLLAQLQLDPEQLVVELNNDILLVNNHAETKLNPGDSLEIVQFVGGG